MNGAVATTLISVLRGSTVDEFDDEVDGATVIAIGIPAAIVEQSRTVRTESDPTPRAVSYYLGRVKYGTDIKAEDRIKDEKTNQVYIVDDVHTVANPFMVNDVRIELRRVPLTQ